MSNKTVDKHFLITVSDTHSTRHFKLRKCFKRIFITSCAVLLLVVVVSNVVIFRQQEEISSSFDIANAFENAFTQLSTRHQKVNRVLSKTKQQDLLLTDVLTQMEQISGVNTEMNTSLIDRLTAISNYYAIKELDFVQLDDRVNVLEASIGVLSNSNAHPSDMHERIELADFGINQQKILLDSIPSGYPTENKKITSAFGKRIHPMSKLSKFHNGVDLKAVKGTNIFATADGVIKEAGNTKISGKHIYISHNYGFSSRYAHLSKILVKPGDVVQKGDLIGLTGQSGRVDGPHLHYEVRHLSKPHNPINFLQWEFGDQEIFTQVRGIQWQSLLNLINKQISRPTLQISQRAPESMEQFALNAPYK